MYLRYDQTTIDTDSSDLINKQYTNGYVFTRLDKGVMDQTRSLRVDVREFALSSENRRILRKTEELQLQAIPIADITYHWSIGKLAKDFYQKKFGPGVFSANRVKHLLTDISQSNFNLLLTYKTNQDTIGYCICYANNTMLHYSYPFYDLNADKNIGMGMMLKAITYAKGQKMQYIYLGSAQRNTDTYKLQFKGLEWFDIDKKTFSKDLTQLKHILKQL